MNHVSPQIKTLDILLRIQEFAPTSKLCGNQFPYATVTLEYFKNLTCPQLDFFRSLWDSLYHIKRIGNNGAPLYLEKVHNISDGYRNGCNFRNRLLSECVRDRTFG